MKCVIPNGNLNMFSRVFHTLAKFGDSVFIEFHNDYILMQSYNSSQSAFGSFNFQTKFFATFTPDKEPIKCKIALKSCFLAFKSHSLDKVVEECHLQMESGDDELSIHFHCKHSVVKSFKLPLMDFELLNTNFSKDKCKNKIFTPPKVLSDCVQNFLSTVDEVTLKVSNEKVSMKNYTEDLPDPNKVVYTEKRLEFDEFLEFEFDREVDLTFCLKEFKAILAFADFGKSNFPLHIHFNGAGEAIIFSICNSDQEWESSFILATLRNENDENDYTQSAKSSSAQSNTGVKSGQSRKEKSGQSGKVKSVNATPFVGQISCDKSNEHARGKSTVHSEINADITNNIRGTSTKSINEAMLSSSSVSDNLSRSSTKIDRNIQNESSTNKKTSDNVLNKPQSPAIGCKMGLQVNGVSQCESKIVSQHETPSILNAPLVDLTQDENDDTQPIENEWSDEFEDTIPPSPPSKRFKHIFLAKNPDFLYTSQLPIDEIVLAPDSDEET